MCLTGVIGISQINSQYVCEDCNNGINLTYELAVKEHGKFCEDKECMENDHEYFSENYYGDEDTILVGYTKDDEGLYIPDTSKEFSYIYNEGILQVTQSKYTKDVRLCSPCYPNQGDLNTIGDYKAYNLPSDYFDKE